MKRTTLYPASPDKVVPDTSGARIGANGIRVRLPLDSYYSRRVQQGDLVAEPMEPEEPKAETFVPEYTETEDSED
jgi:hypothetical protein